MSPVEWLIVHKWEDCLINHFYCLLGAGTQIHSNCTGGMLCWCGNSLALRYLYWWCVGTSYPLRGWSSRATSVRWKPLPAGIASHTLDQHGTSPRFLLGNCSQGTCSCMTGCRQNSCWSPSRGKLPQKSDNRGRQRVTGGSSLKSTPRSWCSGCMSLDSG